MQADSGQTIDVVNPATGLKIGTVPKSGAATETRPTPSLLRRRRSCRSARPLGAGALKLLRKLQPPSWAIRTRWPNCSPWSRVSR